MARCRAASRLMLAGLIVTAVGLVIVLMHTLDIPGYWTTLAVGIALLTAGAVRAVAGGKRKPDRSAS